MMIGALFLASLGIRLAWVFYVQKPGDAIYSDMEGYINKAQSLVSGTQTRHWSVAVPPYGTHYFYALEMLAFGRKNYAALAAGNAVLGATCVACVVWAASRCVDSAPFAWIVGVVSCFWYPLIAFSGFFSSETLYCFFLCVGLVFTFRFIESGKYPIITGLLHGAAFAVRPQMILTVLVFVGWAIGRRKSLCPLVIRRLPWVVLPMALIVTYSAWRYHHFTGDMGLICGNGPATRLLGNTDYWVCTGQVQEDGGRVYAAGLSRPRMSPRERQFSFEGRLVDADIINREIQSYRSGASMANRLWVRMRNLTLLFIYGETMWPEWQEARRSPWRYVVCQVFYFFTTFCWLPCVVFGLCIGLPRRNPYLEVIGLHVFTLLYTALAYLGQIRYRIPHDLLLMIFAALTVVRIAGIREVQPHEASGRQG